MTAEFFIDKLLPNAIVGWGWIPESPETRLEVAIFVNGEYAGKASCDGYRQDLQEAGKGDVGYAMDFHFLEPINFEHAEVVVVSEPFGELYRSAPTHVTVAAASGEIVSQPVRPIFENTDDYKIFIDALRDQRIIGWYVKQDVATGGFVGGTGIVIRLNNLPAARGEVNLPREDVHEAGGPLHCGFDITLPVAMSAGDKVEFCDAATQQVLLTTRYHDADPRDAVASLDTAAAPVLPAERDPEATQLFFDISDLVYYIGHHENLTGIQRVQSCVLLAIAKYGLHPVENVHYLSYDNRTASFRVIEPYYFLQLLNDLGRPARKRKSHFDKALARLGSIEPSVPLEKFAAYAGSGKKVLCLLGAAWINRDYFKRINDLKTEHRFHFLMTVHDLIPIFARETCDQGTAEVFQTFLRKSFRYVDSFLAVSENTANDLKRYAHSISATCPPVYVTRNGSSFNEFFQAEPSAEPYPLEPYVLFVSTIEGRKNHQLVFRLWQELIREGVDMPTVICVGRLGWRANEFLQQLIDTRYLDGKFRILSDVSDSELDRLYENALFTVYPSLYEGWGLPVGESLAKGKICVTTRTASLPEVGGDCAVYIDPVDLGAAKNTIRVLAENAAYRQALEAKIREYYRPIGWAEVAGKIIASALDVARRETSVGAGPIVMPGKEYVFRELSNGRDALGEEMLKVIHESRQGALREALLDNESFFTGHDLRSGSGWQFPESWGCWSSYPKTRLRFTLDAGHRCASGYCLYLKLETPELLLGQSYTINLNGTYLQGRLCDGAPLIQLPLPAMKPADGKAATYVLDFSFDKPTPELAAELRQADRDNRCLGLGFAALLLLARDDVQGRLEVLEKVQFGWPALERAVSQAPRESATPAKTATARESRMSAVQRGK